MIATLRIEVLEIIRELLHGRMPEAILNGRQSRTVPNSFVVIVGRPNVGKSTLFNAILRQRRSIVGDEPGITRDRIYGEGMYRGRRFELIDTGGIIANDDELIPSQILKQARVALEQAAHVIFLIDGRTEITGADRDLAKMLRKLGKPVALAVNKIDSPSARIWRMSFTRSGSSICSRFRPNIIWDWTNCWSTSPPVSRREPAPEPVEPGREDQGRDHRTAERRQIDAAERACGRGAGDCFSRGGHHARCRGRIRGASRASNTSSSIRPESAARARPS